MAPSHDAGRMLNIISGRVKQPEMQGSQGPFKYDVIGRGGLNFHFQSLGWKNTDCAILEKFTATYTRCLMEAKVNWVKTNCYIG